MKKILYIISGAIVLTVLTFVVSDLRPTQPAYGSVQIANEYHSKVTVTPTGGTNIANHAVLATGQGSLGSVVLTGTGSSIILYDATSTVTNAEWATTTLAIIPASASTGTYTFDVIYQKGLLVDFGSGAVATGTITWR